MQPNSSLIPFHPQKNGTYRKKLMWRWFNHILIKIDEEAILVWSVSKNCNFQFFSESLTIDKFSQ